MAREDAWPAEGLPLSEALRRIAPDPNVLDLESLGGAAPSTLWRNRVRRLCALVVERQYTMQGRRGSPVADPQDIPADALSRLNFDLIHRSEARERTKDSQHWYGIRVYAGAPPAPAKPPKAAPAQKSKKQKKRVRPGPKAPHNWNLLDTLFTEALQELASVLRKRYRERNGGLDISERSLNEARQRFMKTGKSEPE
jgi:hypothetical protein